MICLVFSQFVFSNKLIWMEKRKAAGKCICEDIDKIKS